MTSYTIVRSGEVSWATGEVMYDAVPSDGGSVFRGTREECEQYIDEVGDIDGFEKF